MPDDAFEPYWYNSISGINRIEITYSQYNCWIKYITGHLWNQTLIYVSQISMVQILFIIHISTFFNNLWSNVAWLWSNGNVKIEPSFKFHLGMLWPQLWPQSWSRIYLPKRFNYGSDVFKVSKCGSDCGPMWSNVVHIVVLVLSNLWSKYGPNYVNFFQQLMVRCGSSVVQVKIQRLTHIGALTLGSGPIVFPNEI